MSYRQKNISISVSLKLHLGQMLWLLFPPIFASLGRKNGILGQPTFDNSLQFCVEAWQSGHCVRLKHRGPRVRIPPGCKAVIDCTAVSKLYMHCHCVCLRKNKCLKIFLKLS
jgi:hypothetical protein